MNELTEEENIKWKLNILKFLEEQENKLKKENKLN